MRKVAIVMGSDSDLKTMRAAKEMLEQFQGPCCLRILSAHRTPEACRAFALTARQEGYGVLIAGAGKAAHLAGALAANTTLPVIGVPLKSSTLDGLDALLSTVQMPGGMPVATVAIDGAANAALLAVQILAVEDQALAQRYLAYREEMTGKVLEKDRALTDGESGRPWDGPARGN